MNRNAQSVLGRRKWLALAVIALPCLLYAIDITVLNVALPRLSADLRPTSSQLLWIVDIYGFLVAGLLLTMGALGDRIGQRRLLLMGGAGFGAASVFAALSTSAGMLIVARALLGAAGATLAPSGLSLIRNVFADPRERTIAIGVWATSFSVGAAAGPLLGGLVLQHFSWHAVFLLAVPVMLLLLLLGPLLLPEYRNPGGQRLNLSSALLSLSAVLLVIYGLKSAARDGIGWLPLSGVVAGGALAVLFVRLQRRLPDPLLDLRLFSSAAFRISLASFTLTTLVVLGFYLFTAQYLQLVRGLSPFAAGLWMMPASAAVIAGSMLAPLIVRRVRPAYVMGGGIGLTALGFSVLSVLHWGALAGLEVGLVLVYLGLGPVYTLGTDLIIGAAPAERAGAAAAIGETSSELGGALGIAILGSIGTAAYRSSLSSAALVGLSIEARSAAQETLGGAVAIAQHSPPQLAAPLLAAARAAFVHSMEVSAGVCTVLAAFTAVSAAVLLRHASIADGHAALPPSSLPTVVASTVE